MKKKILVFILAIGILVPSFYYRYPWNLSNRFPEKQFYKVEVHETISNRVYSINNKEDIGLLYKYISNRHGRKYFSWFGNGLHGLSQGDENYTFIFMSKGDLSEAVNLIISNRKAYFNFTDGFYQIDDKTFNIKEFRKLLK